MNKNISIMFFHYYEKNNNCTYFHDAVLVLVCKLMNHNKPEVLFIKILSSFSALAFDIISDLQKQNNYIIGNLITSCRQNGKCRKNRSDLLKLLQIITNR